MSETNVLKKMDVIDVDTVAPAPAPDVLPRPTDIGLNYGRNPTITSTALAHSLWSYVLRPNIDTAIDATAGNGGDSVALAEMLFTKNYTASSRSELVAMDVQKQACDRTLEALSSILPPDIMERHVQVLHTSHAPLPYPKDTSSVALVVYNLGWLPSSSSKEEFMTTTESTIASLADAALMLRVGGLISVMTYPRTNRQEHEAVRTFLEGLALFTSITMDWKTFLNEEESIDDEVRDRLRITLEYVQEQGDSCQTWRVHEHKKLGWTDAPVLLTATRIK